MPKKIAITLGEPAGIGVEIVTQLALQGRLEDCIIIGDQALLQKYITDCNLALSLNTKQASTTQLLCENISCNDKVEFGKLNVKNAPYVLSLLNRAAQGCLSGRYGAMVTCPLHKGIINESGLKFSGHTEYLAELSQTSKVVMMLLNKHMRVALLTTHLPLKNVSENITSSNLTETLDILIHDLQHKFAIKSPRIAVCGLNPHAGEEGYLGMEEIETINPVIARYQTKGHNIQGSIPADTLFTPSKLVHYDAVLAMYHDQGLAPLKYAGFGQSVNITLGLPFIRTSVDHGTALDIAGQHLASSDSLLEAIKLARKLANHAK